jgi:hypothetical protein
MGKKTTVPEKSQSIIGRHEEAQESGNQVVDRARSAKRKLAAAQGITIPVWGKY